MCFGILCPISDDSGGEFSELHSNENDRGKRYGCGVDRWNGRREGFGIISVLLILRLKKITETLIRCPHVFFGIYDAYGS